ncbi:MAG: 30S ribosome-binding factor RbfA [Gammaproteobacteria bacterium]|nr:MAG: 30S ribosome-binding factor RbfA [Gammaproteobacteria bacterium]
MPKDFSRNQRVSDQIQRDLSELIRKEIKDPRIGMVTISEVEVAGDLAIAKVYFTVLGGSQEQNLQSGEILNKAAGYLRSLLGKGMKIRTVPQLKFLYDNSFENASQISDLIDKARASDADIDDDEL